MRDASLEIKSTSYQCFIASFRDFSVHEKSDRNIYSTVETVEVDEIMRHS